MLAPCNPSTESQDSAKHPTKVHSRNDGTKQPPRMTDASDALTVIALTYSTTMSAPVEPAFRSNGLLGFGPGRKATELPQHGLSMDSPPPDLEEEPEDFEMDFEAEMEVMREQEVGADLKSSLERLSTPTPAEAKETTSEFRPNGLLFGKPTGLLGGFEPLTAPEPETVNCESASALLTTVRYTSDITTQIFDPPGAPLHAVTSSGSTITFKRKSRRRIDLENVRATIDKPDISLSSKQDRPSSCSTFPCTACCKR